MEPSTNDTEDQIRHRAFELWEQRGRPEGYETEFWLQAERELKGEGTAGASARMQLPLRAAPDRTRAKGRSL